MKISNLLIANVFRVSLALLAAISALALSSPVRAGSLGDFFFESEGEPISRTYDFKGFDQIDVTGIYEMEVRVGGDFSISLSGPAEELEQVQVKVEDGTLTVDQRNSGWNWSKHGKSHHLLFMHRKGITAKITLPKLSRLDVSGIGDVDVTGIDSDLFKTEISGVGDVTLSGSCLMLTAEVSGIGDLDATKLQCKTAEVDVSGIGDASFYASEAAVVEASGIGDVNVHGSPGILKKHGHLLTDIHKD